MDFSTITQFFASLSVNKILPALITLVIGYFAIRFITKFFTKTIGRTKIPKNFHGFLRASIRFVLWALVLLIAASSLGFNVTSLVAVLSVASLALSLAVQGALSNLAGGISVLSTQPFQVGEFVEIGGVSGTILEVGISYTKLNTPDDKLIFVPNSEIASSKIINYSAEDKRRVDLQFTASYDDSVESVKEALREATMLPMVMTDPAPFVAVNNYGDHAICYDVRAWVDPKDYWDAFYGITEQVKIVFDQKKITMTYPHLNVHLDKTH